MPGALWRTARGIFSGRLRPIGRSRGSAGGARGWREYAAQRGLLGPERGRVCVSADAVRAAAHPAAASRDPEQPGAVGLLAAAPAGAAGRARDAVRRRLALR